MNEPMLSESRRAELSALIKPARQAVGMTQREVAEAAGATRQSVASAENGETIPQAKTLRAILAVVGLNIDRERFDKHIESWLIEIGSLIQGIAEDRQSRAINAAVRAIAGEIAADEAAATHSFSSEPTDHDLLAVPSESENTRPDDRSDEEWF